MKRLLVLLLLCSTAFGQGTPVNPYVSYWLRALLDDETQAAAQTTLGLGTGDSPTWAGATVTNCAVLGSNSAVFQPAADAVDFFKVNNAAGTAFIVGDTTNKHFKIYSADGSNYFGIYHDNARTYFTTDDGVFRFITDEGTDTDTAVSIYGKGEGGAVMQLTEGAGVSGYYFKAYHSGTTELSVTGSAPTKFTMISSANVPIRMYEGSTEGNTQELQIYGFGTGFGGKESLDISVEQYAANTADFFGLDNYMFGGNLITWNDTHEDTDGGRESSWSALGEQSGGEQTTLGKIEMSHDGTSDDQLGKIIESVNTGAGLVAVREVDSSGNTKIGDGGTTNYTNVSATGVLTLEGTARRWQSQDLKPSSIKHPSANGPADVEYQNIYFDAYDDTAEEMVYYIWHLPNNYAAGTASVRGHFGGMVSNEAGAEYVAMGFEYWHFQTGETYDTSGAADGGGSVNITIANAEGNYVWHESATGVCDTTGWTNGITVFRFFRDVDDTYTGGNPPYADDYTGDVLIGVYHLEYLRDSLGSA